MFYLYFQGCSAVSHHVTGSRLSLRFHQSAGYSRRRWTGSKPWLERGNVPPLSKIFVSSDICRKWGLGIVFESEPGHWCGYFSLYEGCPKNNVTVTVSPLLQMLTLKAPITTAADDIHKYFIVFFFRENKTMFQVNPLLGRGFTLKKQAWVSSKEKK